MPTARGAGLLLLAAGAYVGGRLVGTYELYLAAVAFTTLLVASLVLVRVGGSRLTLERTLDPHEPTAGDEAEMVFHLHNRSVLPTAPLRVVQPLPSAAGADLTVDISPLRPHGHQVAAEHLPALRRGVFVVEPAVVTYTDPLGAARRRRPLGGEIHVTVLPRIAPLRSCAFFGAGSTAQGRRSRPTPATASVDLRGVRPHQPGEPLSHIDWKSTAKTGILMLREMEEPNRTDVVLVLDGTRSVQVGEPPDDTFETAVNIVGSLGDFALREGMVVSLLHHGATDDQLRFEAGGHTRHDLQTALARADADGATSLGSCLRAQRTLLRHSLVVIVVSPSLDRETTHELMALTERGVPAFLIHIAAPSFASGFMDRPLDPQERRILLQLQAGGIPSLTVRRGDDLHAILAAPEAGEVPAAPLATVLPRSAVGGGGGT